MAGDWLKMRTDLPEDPAVIAIADQMELREEFVVGLLHRFWSWIDKHCATGIVRGISLESIDRRLRLDGLLELLIDVGWLKTYMEQGVPVIEIPNFDRHLAAGAKARSLSTDRQRKSRHADVTVMSRSERDKSVTREEKRREEKSNTDPLSQADARDDSQKSDCDYPEWFEQLWSTYPIRNGRRVGKRKSLDACRKMKLAADQQLREQVAKAIKSYRRHCDSTDTIARDMHRFLEKDFWRDWLEAPSSSSVSSTPAKPDPVVQRNCEIDGMVKAARRRQLDQEWIERHVHSLDRKGLPIDEIKRSFSEALRSTA